MRRWYAAALQRIADTFEEYESGWDLLLRLGEDRPCGLVVTSKSLPRMTGAQVLSMLRAADARIPFVLVAPFCDGSVRSLIDKVPNAALVEDPLDAVRLAEAAETLIAFGPPREARAEKVRRAVELCARGGGVNRRRAYG